MERCSRDTSMGKELTPVDPGVCRLSISDFNSPLGVRRKRTLLSRLCSVAAGKSFCWLRHLHSRPAEPPLLSESRRRCSVVVRSSREMPPPGGAAVATAPPRNITATAAGSLPPRCSH
ncbi:hypothetical protein SASPL_148641 [Salvia splendens]|uniref:Uncharacterized protein n=1 Tax=Salvia splendens TaxID=180675 RepID=A0A8X8Z3X0_SALSN|nr:hypothetical protein SASPL_148641 [Salvia splendens]